MMITGKNNIERYRLFVLKSALAFEIKWLKKII